MKDLKLNLQSSINDLLGASLAIQARRDPDTAASLRTEEQRVRIIPHPSLITKLRTFLGDPSATFKTPEQAEALEIVMAGDRHLLLVGPTAMGKSLVYMLPAAQRNHGTTCVLLPLSALHLDFERRCQDLKIENSRWLPVANEQPRSRIVFVSPEHAQTAKFTNYLIGMGRQGNLVQVVIDEGHLITAHSDFRYCFSTLKPLLKTREYGLFKFCPAEHHTGVPFLIMTATCPPPLRSTLLSYLGIEDCHVIHAPTDRPEISYNVKLHSDIDEATKSLLGSVKAILKEKEEDTTFRGLVYCRGIDQVEIVAKAIGCPAFHASRKPEERATSFKDWVDGRHRFMVCTSLLGCGIDVGGVCAVYHLGTPWSILDFVQESGRGGRGGQHSVSIIFAAKSEREPQGKDVYGKAVMRRWVLQKKMCRRTTLSSFLDGGRMTCVLLKGAALCDYCTIESRNQHPRQLAQFQAPAIPNDDIPAFRELPNVPPTSLEYETELRTFRR